MRGCSSSLGGLAQCLRVFLARRGLATYGRRLALWVRLPHSSTFAARTRAPHIECALMTLEKSRWIAAEGRVEQLGAWRWRWSGVESKR